MAIPDSDSVNKANGIDSTDSAEIAKFKAMRRYMADLEQRVGVTALRNMTLAELRELDRILLVEEYTGRTSKPLAALIPYEVYMHMQALILKVRDVIR